MTSKPLFLNHLRKQEQIQRELKSQMNQLKVRAVSKDSHSSFVDFIDTKKKQEPHFIRLNNHKSSVITFSKDNRNFSSTKSNSQELNLTFQKSNFQPESKKSNKFDNRQSQQINPKQQSFISDECLKFVFKNIQKYNKKLGEILNDIYKSESKFIFLVGRYGCGMEFLFDSNLVKDFNIDNMSEFLCGDFIVFSDKSFPNDLFMRSDGSDDYSKALKSAAEEGLRHYLESRNLKRGKTVFLVEKQEDSSICMTFSKTFKALIDKFKILNSNSKIIHAPSMKRANFENLIVEFAKEQRLYFNSKSMFQTLNSISEDCIEGKTDVNLQKFIMMSNVYFEKTGKTQEIVLTKTSTSKEPDEDENEIQGFAHLLNRIFHNKRKDKITGEVSKHLSKTQYEDPNYELYFDLDHVFEKFEDVSDKINNYLYWNLPDKVPDIEEYSEIMDCFSETDSAWGKHYNESWPAKMNILSYIYLNKSQYDKAKGKQVNNIKFEALPQNYFSNAYAKLNSEYMVFKREKSFSFNTFRLEPCDFGISEKLYKKFKSLVDMEDYLAADTFMWVQKLKFKTIN